MRKMCEKIKKIMLIFSCIVMTVFVVVYGAILIREEIDEKVNKFMRDKIVQFEEMMESVDLYDDEYFFEVHLKDHKGLNMYIFFPEYDENKNYDFDNVMDIIYDAYKQSELYRLHYFNEIEYVFFEIVEGEYGSNSSSHGVYWTTLRIDWKEK